MIRLLSPDGSTSDVTSTVATSTPQITDSTMPTSDDSGDMFSGMTGTVGVSVDTDVQSEQDGVTVTAQVHIGSESGSNTFVSAATEDHGSLDVVVNNGRVSATFNGAQTPSVPIHVSIMYLFYLEIYDCCLNVEAKRVL